MISVMKNLGVAIKNLFILITPVTQDQEYKKQNLISR